jgi:hypothetical protein
MFHSLRQRFGLGDPPELIAEGRIVEIQQPSSNGNGSSLMEFKLDTRADLTFRQAVSPLSPVHKRGDQVRVHYEASRDNSHVAVVRWIESEKS